MENTLALLMFDVKSVFLNKALIILFDVNEK